MKRKKIRSKIYRFDINSEHLKSSYWKRWFLDVKCGFFIWDEPDNTGRYVCGSGSFDFGRNRKKLIQRIKMEGSVVFGKEFPRNKIKFSSRARI